jgi:thymidylate synthase (FAD)
MNSNRFRVEVIRRTEKPQQLIWLSAHQCVCEDAAIDDELPDEPDAGAYAIKHLLAGHRGHYSPLEAPQISFNVIDLPHSVMQQIRTHRIGLHFSVQSFRYTGQRIADVALGKRDVEDVFYLRPVGEYADRKGKRYEYTSTLREDDLQYCRDAASRYKRRINQGFSEEHARGLIPFDVRQHWVMSANVRSLMHMLDLRFKKDAQLEAQQLCEEIWPHFAAWVPQIAEWYKANRLGKARLSP